MECIKLDCTRQSSKTGIYLDTPIESITIVHCTTVKHCHASLGSILHNRFCPTINILYDSINVFINLHLMFSCFTYTTRSSDAAEAEIAHIVPHKPKLSSVRVGCTFSLTLKLTQLAPTAVVLGEITRNDGHWAIQGQSRSSILVSSKPAYDFLLINDTNILHNLI